MNKDIMPSNYTDTVNSCVKPDFYILKYVRGWL